MKTMKLSILIVLSLLFTVPRMANAASATATFGAGCSMSAADCPGGTPMCSAGLFSCECHCSFAPKGVMNIPSLGSQELADAASFGSWLNNYGTSEMTQLATDTYAVIAALTTNNTTYSYAEYTYSDDYAILSSTEKVAILNWAYTHGY